MADGDIGTFAALAERFEPPPGSYKKPKLLYCSNGGHFLRIRPDGRVDGTRDRSDPHGKCVPCSGCARRGPSMGTLPLPGDECLFLERLEENHYNTYVSKAHAEQRWFVGLKKDGSSKAGPRTHGGQKAVLFLPLPDAE
ncbi:FGF1 factor, partial [Crypturellus undulatus]|nr:FGF1 factor [Crypturellus undulatus]